MAEYTDERARGRNLSLWRSCRHLMGENPKRCRRSRPISAQWCATVGPWPRPAGNLPNEGRTRRDQSVELQRDERPAIARAHAQIRSGLWG